MQDAILASDPHLLELAREALTRGLRRARSRARLVLWAQWTLTALFPLTLLLIVTTLLLKLFGVWYHQLWPLALLAMAAVGAALTAIVRPLPDALMAASLDRRLSLKDRLTSVWWLIGAGGTPAVPVTPRALDGMDFAAVQDGVAHLRDLPIRRAYALPPATRLRPPGLALALLLAIQFAPLPPWFLSQQRRAERAELREQAIAITPVVREFREQADKGQDAAARDAARKLQRLHKDLLRGKLDRKQALLKMGELQKELERVAKRDAPDPAKARQEAAKLSKQGAEKLAQAASQAARQAAQQNKPEVARKLQKLSQQAKTAQSPQALQQLHQQLSKAAQDAGLQLPPGLDLPISAAAALSQNSSDLTQQQLDQLTKELAKKLDSLTPEQCKALAKELAKLAETMKQSGSKGNCDKLMAAARCLGKCDNAGAKAALGKNCSKAGAMAAAAEAAQRGLACRSSGSCASTSEGPESGLGAGGIGRQDRLPANAPGATLYAPRQADVPATPQQVGAHIGNPQGGIIAGQTRGAPDATSASRVPYYEVVGGYSRTAEEALAREEVPPTYRGTVRDYFKALEGDKPEGKR